MTVLRVDRVKRKNIVFLKCDQCGNEYLCDDRSKKRAINQKYHFCSNDCRRNASSKPNGILYLKAQKTLFDKYGGYFTSTSQFKEDQRKFCLDKYGVESRLEADEIIEKIKQTNLNKYGKETFAGTNEHKSKLNYDEIAVKAWKTKIKNGTCSKSGPEEKLNAILIEKFGSNNVIRQVEMMNQWIDFYIKPIDLYIQVDGVYWHGLNRKFSEIKLKKTSQDEKIYKQILRDRKLNRYMKKNKFKLVRLTDHQINKYNSVEILSIIKENQYAYI